jgi:hypothetical protein
MSATNYLHWTATPCTAMAPILSVEVASGPAPLQFRRADSIKARGLALAPV